MGVVVQVAVELGSGEGRVGKIVRVVRKEGACVREKSVGLVMEDYVQINVGWEGGWGEAQHR